MSGLPNIRGQIYRDRMYDASGTITSGSTAQLVLPEAKMRSSFLFVNNSATNMYLEIGAPRATATLTNGVVTSISVTNAGFGYTVAPAVKLIGGAFPGSATVAVPYSGVMSDVSWPAPQNPASAYCVMTGAAGSKTISSIALNSGGSLYQFPPYVLLTNHDIDPFGAAAPSATSGILVAANGGSYTSNGSLCTTDQLAVFCTAANASFTCKYTI